MEYRQLSEMKEDQSAFRLMRAEHFPLIASFLWRAFKERHLFVISFSELKTQLDDYLFELQERDSTLTFPLTPKEYLENWADSGFLRKYYAQDDEPQFELTADTEKVLEWVWNLQRRDFVGTESRLLTIFYKLRSLVDMTDTNASSRIERLKAQRDEIDEQIRFVEAGGVAQMDETQVRDFFGETVENARRLLSDFREIEENFRRLDMDIRERIALSSQGKKEVLAHWFEQQDLISDSDQGRSFQAFWEFLMTPERQRELRHLIERALTLQDMPEDYHDVLNHLNQDILMAAERAHTTKQQLVEQLRIYLENRAYLENRRIAEILQQIEHHAISIKDEPPPLNQPFYTLPEPRADVQLPLERRLFKPPMKIRVDSGQIELGESEFEADFLFRHNLLDVDELRDRVRLCFAKQNPLPLTMVFAHYPVQLGVAEVVSYINLALNTPDSKIDLDNPIEVEAENSEQGTYFRLSIPKVTFVRSP